MPVKKGGRRGGIVKSKGKEKPQEKQAVDKEKRAEPQEITGVAVSRFFKRQENSACSNS